MTTHIRTNMKPEDLRDLLFVWFEAMRRIGFKPDEIFVMYGILDPGLNIVCWGIRLKVGEQEWHGCVGTTRESEDKFRDRWEHFVANEQKSLSNERGVALWKKYMPIDLFEQLVAALMVAGMPLRSFQQ